MKFLQRTIVSLLAVLMFTSASCFAVDVHLCKDEVKSRAFFSKAKPCKMMTATEKKNEPDCCKKRRLAKEAALKKGVHFKKKACCHNKSFAYKSDVNQGGQSLDFTAVTLNSILPNQTVFIVTESGAETLSTQTFRGPPEPDVSYDYYSLYQVYLI